LKNADAAMYEAKQPVATRTPSTGPSPPLALPTGLATKLHGGLERGDFVARYQPIFSIERRTSSSSRSSGWR